MGRKTVWLGAVALLAIGAWLAAPASASAQGPESEAVMSEDAERMHERLIALSRGEDSMSDLRIEFMEGSMSSHRSFDIEAGKLVSKDWTSPGSPMIRREGSVTNSRVSLLLQQLIANQYWNFQGSRFVPDAPMFLFRFYYRDMPYVDFRCDAQQIETSKPRTAIRNLFLDFASEIEMKTIPAQQRFDGR